MSEFIPSFSHKDIEPKWQKAWEVSHAFQAVDFSKKPPYYCLVEFPYPSGEGMHNGHIRAYMSLETISRKRRMEGFNVLFPIGFDAFGLPTENYAIKHHIHPRIVTDQNIQVFTRQLKAAGFSFDFSRVVDTTDPEYYRFTQWIFLKMFEKGLVYKSKAYVNFCPDCKVVLSNEESQGGICDRCGSEVEQKEKDVWFLKITAYAKRLLEGLDKLECPSRIRIEQENWIGESEGALIQFPLKDTNETLEVFTTRPDTIYGATFMVIAPEHELLKRYQERIQNWTQIEEYQEQAKKKTEFERVQLVKEKTGVLIQGLEAINPLTKEAIPIFIADYVMITYGTGAIMAVPGHDQRDYEFAKKFGLDIIEVIAGGDLSDEAYTDIDNGVLVNSPLINGLLVKDAIAKMAAILEATGMGVKTRQFKMKDWAFNRQRYWGEPIPIIYCEKCGVVPVPFADLPVTLPMIDQYEPTTSGESPLANVKEFVNCTCPICHGLARRETDTMPQWAGSSWYYLRYLDPKNPAEIASKEKQAYWGQVNWYNGGMEHVTRHLIYSRFWNQFLFDIGEVLTEEPYKKRTAQGLILGADGEKMSKSKGNVVNPMAIIDEYGADTLRMYLLFIGDYEMPTPWNENGVKGCRRFLDKVWRAFPKVTKAMALTETWENLIHKTIKGVSEDMENLKFNTAIAKLMTLMNEYTAKESISKGDYETLLKLLYPFSPHVTEELWQMLGHSESLVFEPWPSFDPSKLTEESVEIVISINGKVRDKLVAPFDLAVKELEARALKQPRIKELLGDRPIRKVICIPNKLVNIVQ
ncbi:MAG: leucine--tRNA ligase [Candidatus Izemoplasmatales bacterium]|jgi:leucyl-tRNA synthetase|nr:leucine--tRNA ligase [Candidatus Izemoplasmatales bacterium]MDD4988256.1 leucine--tRNA ligase [Candidatus Izemoplasmatales bacterium]